MNLLFNSYNNQLCLLMRVKTPMPQKIKIHVRDANMPKTVYTNRYKTVNGEFSFLIRLPITPKVLAISVYNQKNGNMPEGKDKTFSLVEKRYIPLITKVRLFDFKNPLIRSFVQFALEFSQAASYISAGQSVYVSDDGKFRIDYADVIKDSKGGVLRTPARISQDTGRIEISKQRFNEFTVPMRFITLLHEFSHYYINKDMSREDQADFNALLIYLGLGFPRIEAIQAFTEIFVKSPHMVNAERWLKIKKFITEFEDVELQILN